MIGTILPGPSCLDRIAHRRPRRTPSNKAPPGLTVTSRPSSETGFIEPDPKYPAYATFNPPPARISVRSAGPRLTPCQERSRRDATSINVRSHRSNLIRRRTATIRNQIDRIERQNVAQAPRLAERQRRRVPVFGSSLGHVDRYARVRRARVPQDPATGLDSPIVWGVT